MDINEIIDSNFRGNVYIVQEDNILCKQSTGFAEIHSTAWKQAYENVFPVEFIAADTIAKRKEEFLASWNEKEIDYFLLFDEAPVGMMKIRHCENACEILSIYLLKRLRRQNYEYQKEITVNQFDHVYYRGDFYDLRDFLSDTGQNDLHRFVRIWSGAVESLL